jgi:hypothetical protein
MEAMGPGLGGPHVQTHQIGCIEPVGWGIALTCYVFLVVPLAEWICHALGVNSLVLALPLGVLPVLLGFKEHWRDSWVFVVPVVAAMLVTAHLRQGPHPKSALLVPMYTMLCWFPVMGIINSIRFSRRKPEP